MITGEDNDREREIDTTTCPPQGCLPLVAVGRATASWETLPNIVHLPLVRAVCETRSNERVSINTTVWGCYTRVFTNEQSDQSLRAHNFITICNVSVP